MTQKNEMSACALKMEELEMVNVGAPAAAPAPRGRGMLGARGRNRGIFV